MQMLTHLKRLVKPEIFFVVCAALFGSLMIVLTPPMQTFDEQDHFFRSYQLAQFNLMPDMVTTGPQSTPQRAPGGIWPVSILGFGYNFLYQIRLADGTGHERQAFQQQMAAFKTTKIDPSRTQAAYLPVAGAYSPVPYIPQILAVLIGKIADTPIMWFYYLGRIFNLVAWIVLVYLAIRLLPVGKWLLAIIALWPISLYQATTWSADALTNALVFLTISMFMYYSLREPKIQRRDVAVMTLLGVALALCKSAFWPMAFLFWLVPIAKFSSKKHYLVSNLIISGATVLFFAGWFMLINFTVPYMPLVNNPGEAINTQQQLSGIIHNPFHFISVLPAVPYAYMITGLGFLGWREAPIGWLAGIVMALATLWGILLVATERKLKQYTWLPRVGSLAIAGALFLLTAVSLYTTFTPIGANSIHGLQSRYFITYLPFLIPITAGLAYALRKKVAIVHRYAFAVIPAVVFVLSMAIVAIIQRYY
jgi:uncharacterized membrane protein